MCPIDELTRSKRVELARFHELAESLDQSLVLVAADLSHVFYASPAYERMTGVSCASLYDSPRLGRSQSMRKTGQGFELVAKRVSGELQGKSEMEYRIRTASGETRWLRSVITPAFDEAGQADSLRRIGRRHHGCKQAELRLKVEQRELAAKSELRAEELSRTVTRLQQEIEQRKQIESELRRSETRFRRLFEANIIGVLFSDIYGSINEANEAFLANDGLFAFRSPLRWDNMTPREWSHASELTVQQLVARGLCRQSRRSTFGRTARGFLVLMGSALLDRETWQCVTFVIDLTGRKNAEEQVREVNLQLEHASRLSVMGEMLADLCTRYTNHWG